MTLLEQIRAKAKAANKTIVLAEGTEERTLKVIFMVSSPQIFCVVRVDVLYTMP